jgi:hypothetical protein
LVRSLVDTGVRLYCSLQDSAGSTAQYKQCHSAVQPR